MDRNSQLKRRDRPRRKPHAKSVVTTIGSLSDDNLADILLRLPRPVWPPPVTSSAATGPSIHRRRSSGSSSALPMDSPCSTVFLSTPTVT